MKETEFDFGTVIIDLIMEYFMSDHFLKSVINSDIDYFENSSD